MADDRRPSGLPLHTQPGATPTEPTEATPFTQMGGAPTIERLVDRFYHHMDTLPEAATIRAMHDADLGEIKRVLVMYLTQWTGGPGDYSAERGHPRLRRRHLPFAIGVAERDAWMACMRRAMAETVSDDGVRAMLDERLLHLADFMRNQPEPGES